MIKQRTRTMLIALLALVFLTGIFMLVFKTDNRAMAEGGAQSVSVTGQGATLTAEVKGVSADEFQFWVRRKTQVALNDNKAQEEFVWEAGDYSAATTYQFAREGADIDGICQLLVKYKTGTASDYIYFSGAITETGALITAVQLDGEDALSAQTVYLPLSKTTQAGVLNVELAEAGDITVNGEVYNDSFTLDFLSLGANTLKIETANDVKSIDVRVYNDGENYVRIDSLSADFTGNTADITVNTTSFGDVTPEYTLSIEGLGVIDSFSVNGGVAVGSAEFFAGRYGNYYSVLTATDAGGNILDQYTCYINYARGGVSVNGGYSEADGVYTVSAQTVSGLTNTLYQFVKWDAKGEYVVKNWGEESDVAFKPSVGGSYRFEVRVKGDESCKWEASDYVDFTHGAAETGSFDDSLNISSNGGAVYSRMPNQIAVGYNSLVDGDNLLYKFVITKAGTYRVEQYYSPIDGFVWVPNTGGDYNIQVRVINKNSYGWADEVKNYAVTVENFDYGTYRLYNGGFENGLDGWTLSNGKMGGVSDETNYWKNDPDSAEGYEFGMDGDYMFSAYVAGAEENDIGTLTSSTFTVGGSGFITYKIGAAADDRYVYLDVVDSSNGNILGRYGNPLWEEFTDGIKSGCRLIPYKVDLSAYMGKQVYIKLTDNGFDPVNQGKFRLFFLDSVNTYYAKEPTVGFSLNEKVNYSVPENIYRLINGGFEAGNLTGWTANNTELTAFSDACVTSIDTYWDRSFYRDGNYHFTSLELDKGFFENGKGSMRSSLFTLGGSGWISFKLGGGANRDLIYAAVKKENGTEVARFYNQEFARTADGTLVEAGLNHYKYKLSDELIGETLYFEIVDNAPNGWGIVSLDSFEPYHTVEPNAMFTAINMRDIYRVENGGFETGNLAGWTIEGDIGNVSDNPNYWATNPFNMDGSYMFSAYEPDDKESQTGTLTSSAFTVGGSGFITYMLGGMNDPEVYMEIIDVDTGEQLAKFGNPMIRECALIAYKADLSDFVGRFVRIRLVDNAINNYGLIFCDAFVTYYEDIQNVPDYNLAVNLI